MTKINPKEAIKPIDWLIGKWKSVEAHGEFPGINSFNYSDELEFNFFGQPLLSYSSKTCANDENHTPKHYESGFLKIIPNTNKLSFLVAHNFGLNSIEEGEVNGCEIYLKSNDISRMSFAKEPAVCKIERSYKLNGDNLEMVLYMATSQKPLAKHLTVVYSKEC